MVPRPKANFSLAAVLDGAVEWGRRHPGMVVLLGFLVVFALQEAGVVEPLDWWGDGMEVGR